MILKSFASTDSLPKLLSKDEEDATYFVDVSY